MSASQSFSVPVFFLIGKSLTEQVSDALSDAMVGGHGIKAALEADPMVGTDNAVLTAKGETITVGGVEYLSLTFTVDVITQGGVAFKDVRNTLAARLKAAGYKNVHAFPTSPVQTPGVVIGYPTDIDLQMTFG